MNRLEAARQATKLQEWATIILVSFLTIMALGWIAMRGDDIRADRMGVTVEELDQIERSRWADHPNDSTCGWSCIERIPKTGETWGE